MKVEGIPKCSPLLDGPLTSDEKGIYFSYTPEIELKGADMTAIAERKRRALRVHLGADTEAGLKQLETLIASVLEP